MKNVDSKFYEKKKTGTFYLALGFFIVVLLMTGGLHYYKMQIDEKNEVLSGKKQTITSSIKSLEEDPDIQIYSIYEANKTFFATQESYSQIPSFVNHFKKYFAKYDIDAKGFRYNNGEVTISLSSDTDDWGFAYQKIVTFIEEYTEAEAARFMPKQVNSFSGYDRIKYTGTFTLKDQ